MEPTSSNAVPKFIRLDLNVDLALHAVPALTLFLDFILFERPYSHKAARRGAPLLSVLAALWYGSWVEYCASYNGTCESFDVLASTMRSTIDYLLSPLSIPHGEPASDSHNHIFRGMSVGSALILGSQLGTYQTYIGPHRVTASIAII